MLKKVLMAVAVVSTVALGLYLFTDVRIALDGTGRWPRVERATNFDALDADRARQREQAPTVASADVTVPAPIISSGTTAAAASVAVSQPAVDVSTQPGYWPDFRGPNRDGRYVETSIRTDWPPEGLPRLWKQPIGLGYASFVAAGGRAFTIEQRRGKEVVAAYDVETGRELWTNAWDAEFTEAMGGDGPRATPTYHEGKVYALGATGEFRCLDARSGAVIWRHDILAESSSDNLQWGMSASPLIVDNKVIVLPGGKADRSVVAYDKSTGQLLWHVLGDQASYTAPMLVTLAGVRQLLVVTAERVIGLTVEEGNLLWEYRWETNQGINVSQPLLLGNDRVFLSAAYDHGAAVIELSRTNGRFTVRQIWTNNRMKNKFTSSVLRDGFVYGLDEAILACIDAATGALKWKGGRYGYGQVLLAGEHLIVLTEDGDLALVRATPDRHVELAKFQAIEGKSWNHPVIVNGRLLVRNLQEMAAFDIRPPSR